MDMDNLEMIKVLDDLEGLQRQLVTVKKELGSVTGRLAGMMGKTKKPEQTETADGWILDTDDNVVRDIMAKVAAKLYIGINGDRDYMWWEIRRLEMECREDGIDLDIEPDLGYFKVFRNGTLVGYGSVKKG